MKLFSTSCETLYLGWDAPLIPRAVSVLVDRFASDGHLDLDAFICVLPTLRGVQRLSALLRRAADQNDLVYFPPKIITAGNLPEHLYRAHFPVASYFEQTLAWAHVLKAVDPRELEPLLPSLPPGDALGPWLEIGGVLQSLHEELAANRLSFGHVIEVAETDREQSRWRLLCQLFDRYLTTLADAELSDPHHARQEAIATNAIECSRTIVMIGTSDISEALIAMLRSLEGDQIAVVAAPPEQQHKFDEFGCVQTANWTDHQLPLKDEQLIAADDMTDQAAAVAESLADFAPSYLPSQLTIGVTDASQVGPVEFELRARGVETYRQLGWTVSQTAIGRLLDLTATHLQRKTWQSLAALVRHAAVAQWIESHLDQPTETWLAELDRLLSEHYPLRVRNPLSPRAIKNYPLAGKVSELVQKRLHTLTKSDQTIAQWSEVISGWIDELYPDANNNDAKKDDADTNGIDKNNLATDPAVNTEETLSDAPPPSRTARAIAVTRKILEHFASINQRLDTPITGPAAIEMLAGRLADVRVQDRGKPDDVRILGWLDLALDDAPALIVNGLNHPFVPAGVTSDPFLPGEIRSRLVMSDNERRFARDVYAMQLMISTRRDVRFIVGKRAADLSPTPPSRLLSAAGSKDVARRMRKLLGQRRPAIVVAHRWDPVSAEPAALDSQARAGIAIPPLPSTPPEEAVKTMSVTAFRDYLACPYRFYLRHVLKLKPLADDRSELAANQFGDLVHGALEAFGESDDRHETDVKRIEEMLVAHLDAYAAEFYGDHVSVAVQLQIEQARQRMQSVARAQAERTQAGWIIHATEASVDEKRGACIEIDGRKMGLRGRFDRIDKHPDTGQWAILDYKTHGHPPEKKHLKKQGEREQWIDLQLPLYRRMIPFLKIDAEPQNVQLGYFNVSEKESETRVNQASFTQQQLDAADQLIEQCVQRIWEGDFHPTDEQVLYDDYEMILQTGVASRMFEESS